MADEIISEASLDKSFNQRFNTVPAELYDNFGYFLPDRGDGIEGFIHQDKVLKCPDFAENIPPGKCPAKITSIRLLSRADVLFDENVNNIKIFGVRIEQNLHFQKIIIPLPSDFFEIRSVTIKNHLKNVEMERFENPALETIDEGRGLCLHIGHFAPGFYETVINLPKEKFIRLRFIKFFPEYFSSKYSFIEANPPEEKNTFYIEEVGFRPEDYLNKPSIRENEKFSDEILNIALEIKTEWGENFKKPIDERILQKSPDLTTAEISELDKIAGEAESFIYQLAELELKGEIFESNISENARQKFVWLNDANLFRLKNIAMYYARR